MKENNIYKKSQLRISQMLLAFLFLLGSFDSMAQANCVDSSLINPNAICPAIYAPVCGCNNITYGNECEAINLGGVTSWTPGECSGGVSCVDSSLINLNVACPLIYAPVCGCDGVTYGNTCEAQNYGGVTSWTNGPCNGGNGCVDPSLINLNVPCPEIYDPVCGCDGITYSNTCEAQNYGGVTSWTSGPCNGGSGCVDSSMIDPSIMCIALYDPVCGCDGITYGNACEAENWYGITSWTPGPCNGGNGCIDTSMIDPSIMCPAVFDPVCGCDGITYGNACEAENWYGITSWTPGACGGGSGCIDSSLMNIGIQCPAIYEPVCGCDGITYENTCFATNYGGVTSWIPGPCGGVQLADSCSNLGGIDFGACALFLGYGLVNGVCTPISGCSTIVNGVDYQLALSGSESECQEACAQLNESQPCEDISNVDFGICAMPLGIGIINGQCAMISGCDWVVNGTDYSPALYSTMDSCQACLPANQVDELSNADLNLYPNPTTGKITLKLSKLISGNLAILDVTGRVLLSDQLNGLSHELDLSALSSGTYYVQIQSENARLTKKVIKK